MFKYWRCPECFLAAEVDMEARSNVCLVIDTLIDGDVSEHLVKRDCPFFAPGDVVSEPGNEREDVFWVK